MSKGISRRNFLKASAIGALGVAATTVACGIDKGTQTVSAAMTTATGAETTAATTQAETSVEPTTSVPGTSTVIDRAQLPKRAWDDPEIQLKVRWSGVNFYEFVLPNGKTIVMDPYFDDPNDDHNEYKYTPTDLPGGQWVNGADVVVLTHGHGDHTGEVASVLTEYPKAQVIIPEGTLPSVIWRHKINYAGHYFSEAGSHDKFEFPGFVMETIRSNHNCGKEPKADELDQSKYLDEDGKIDFLKFYGWLYEREIMNMKITTDEGFTILIWNSEMQADGQGFETRPYFYRDANPDLFMYQVAGASFDYDRRNPNCKHMGEWIASVKGKTALPEHQQHFSYDELDAMSEKFSEICNDRGVGTSFLTPETGIWYGYTKDANGNISICLVEDKA